MSSPRLPGSYGRGDVSFGGGIVRLKTGSLTLNGTISANATTQRTKAWESGGSAGGSSGSAAPVSRSAAPATGDPTIAVLPVALGGAGLVLIGRRRRRGRR